MKMRIISKQFNKIDVTTIDDAPNKKYVYVGAEIDCILQKYDSFVFIKTFLTNISPETPDQEIMDRLQDKITYILN